MGATFTELKRLKPHLDLFVEVVDARAPRSTRPHALVNFLAGKPGLTVLSRADLARADLTQAWVRALGHCIPADLRTFPQDGLDKAIGRLVPAKARPRVVFLGLPNVGKSTLLNRLVGSRAARVGNRPGITRGPQWVRGSTYDFLDLAGLTPRRATPLLYVLGLVPEGSVDPEAAMEAIWPHLAETPEGIEGVPWDPDMEVTLKALGERWGLLEKGGDPSVSRTAQRLVKLFQDGRVGRFTLERPDEAP